jgi:hypothetical protein
MAYGSSIYIIVLIFSLLAIINSMVPKSKISTHQIVNHGLIIFSGTWIYQIGTQLINLLIEQSIVRWDQILNAITHGILERPTTSSTMEQNIHFIYWFDYIIVPLAYIFPVLLTFTSLIYFLYRFFKTRNEFNGMLLALSIACILLFITSGIFAWKGIENAIARYLYLYGTTISVIVNISLLASLTQERNISVVFLTILLVLGTAIETESFYTPYASLIASPDYSKFTLLFERYYSPSTLSFNNIGMMMHLEFGYGNNLFLMAPYTSHLTVGDRIYDNYFVSFYYM